MYLRKRELSLQPNKNRRLLDYAPGYGSPELAAPPPSKDLHLGEKNQALFPKLGKKGESHRCQGVLNFSNPKDEYKQEPLFSPLITGGVTGVLLST